MYPAERGLLYANRYVAFASHWGFEFPRDYRVLYNKYPTGAMLAMCGRTLYIRNDVERIFFQTTRRKMYDVLNAVGLSSTLSTSIDRRQRVDAWIVRGGMVSNNNRRGGGGQFRGARSFLSRLNY